MKRGWEASGFNNKIPSQSEQWFRDLSKLDSVKGAHTKVFILISFTQNSLDETQSRFATAVGQIGQDKSKIVLPSVTFQWRTTKVRWLKAQAFFWQPASASE